MSTDLNLLAAVSGRKPQTEARRHVYRILACIIDNVSERPWFIDDDELEHDERRIKKAMRAVKAELLRKGCR